MMAHRCHLASDNSSLSSIIYPRTSRLSWSKAPRRLPSWWNEAFQGDSSLSLRNDGETYQVFSVSQIPSKQMRMALSIMGKETATSVTTISIWWTIHNLIACSATALAPRILSPAKSSRQMPMYTGLRSIPTPPMLRTSSISLTEHFIPTHSLKAKT